LSSWNETDLRRLLLAETPLIDVRAPIEFAAGSIPNSVNIPILKDEERKLVGTCYKEKGQACAILLGHELVSGTVKDQRLEAWIRYLKQFPEAEVFCFRGGLRSQITCDWLREAGFHKTPVTGGYKRMRQFFLSYLLSSSFPNIFRLAGLTGTGKTKLLSGLKASIDLEGLASHRGSAFGAHGPQPSQIFFENLLAMGLMKAGPLVIVEDESSTIGVLAIPTRFYKSMRSAPMILLVSGMDDRIRNIFEEYVIPQDETFFQQGLQRISRKLGNKMCTEISLKLQRAFKQGKVLQHHEEWISLLLTHYYDPIYQKDYLRYQHQIIFQGNADEIYDYVQSLYI
jgi:tRNA 2-selenouridine synthase